MIFKTRFIYPLFFVFFIFAVAMSIVVRWFYFWFVPSVFIKEAFDIKNLGMAAVGLLLFGYPAAHIIYMGLTLRYGIKIIEESIILKDLMFWQPRVEQVSSEFRNGGLPGAVKNHWFGYR